MMRVLYDMPVATQSLHAHHTLQVHPASQEGGSYETWESGRGWSARTGRILASLDCTTAARGSMGGGPSGETVHDLTHGS